MRFLLFGFCLLAVKGIYAQGNLGSVCRLLLSEQSPAGASAYLREFSEAQGDVQSWIGSAQYGGDGANAPKEVASRLLLAKEGSPVGRENHRMGMLGPEDIKFLRSITAGQPFAVEDIPAYRYHRGELRRGVFFCGLAGTTLALLGWTGLHCNPEDYQPFLHAAVGFGGLSSFAGLIGFQDVRKGGQRKSAIRDEWEPEMDSLRVSASSAPPELGKFLDAVLAARPRNVDGRYFMHQAHVVSPSEARKDFIVTLRLFQNGDGYLWHGPNQHYTPSLAMHWQVARASEITITAPPENR